ncbi:MAG: hypothetical protein ACTSR2_02105 [Candidatus Hodarchaeales archaeon]
MMGQPSCMLNWSILTPPTRKRFITLANLTGQLSTAGLLMITFIFTTTAVSQITQLMLEIQVALLLRMFGTQIM